MPRLTLSRNLGERVGLFLPSGEVIAVRVVAGNRTRLKIMIEAAPEVTIVREEIMTPEQRKKIEAIPSGHSDDKG